jgi:hypothetical protein
VAQQPNTGLDRLFVDVSRSHTIRHTHTAGRTPLDEWSARRRDLYLTTQTLSRDKHPCPAGIRTHDPSKRSAADPRLRPRDHWDRHTHTHTHTHTRTTPVSSSMIWQSWYYIESRAIVIQFPAASCYFTPRRFQHNHLLLLLLLLSSSSSSSSSSPLCSVFTPIYLKKPCF